jgi:cation:H+ antiporter
MVIWLQFIVCTAVIVFSGSRLSTYGDVIAEKTGMGQTWIGVVLMASVTSLPELFTGVSAVALYNLPNIAAGDVLGSCMFNLVILAALDVGSRRAPLSSLAHQGQVLTAAFGVVLLGTTTISILAANAIPSIGWFGLYSLIILAVYLLAMRMVFQYERRRIAEFLADVKEEAHYPHVSKRQAYLRFAFFAALIIVAATLLPYLANEIAEITGLGRTFVGSMFVAMATSLPEIAVSLSALRTGAVDLAVGNLLGSNLFNVSILAIDDLFYLKGPILRHVSTTNALTAVAAMTMTAVVTVALIFRSKRKILFVSWDALTIFAIYAAVAILLFLER